MSVIVSELNCPILRRGQERICTLNKKVYYNLTIIEVHWISNIELKGKKKKDKVVSNKCAPYCNEELPLYG